jgi:hypothetical protein
MEIKAMAHAHGQSEERKIGDRKTLVKKRCGFISKKHNHGFIRARSQRAPMQELIMHIRRSSYLGSPWINHGITFS